MNRLLTEQDEDDQYEAQRQGKDREISLGTTMLLGIFFALALLCAVFFGFGYSLGSRHAAPAVAAEPTPTPSSSFSGFKPSPGSPLSQSAGKNPYTAASQPPPPPSVTVRTPAARAAPDNADSEPASAPLPTPAPIVRQPPAPVSQAAASIASTPGSSVVQIAAVSHQEDADLLVSTLKRRGYNVAIRQEPQDRLLHVQIGPFPNRKDADAMRQRLLSDGFNAIVK